MENAENYSEMAFFLCSRLKKGRFFNFPGQIFFWHFFGLQEGTMQLEILIPPMVAFENLVSGSA